MELQPKVLGMEVVEEEPAAVAARLVIEIHLQEILRPLKGLLVDLLILLL
jgi:hypothetical protein